MQLSVFGHPWKRFRLLPLIWIRSNTTPCLPLGSIAKPTALLPNRDLPPIGTCTATAKIGEYRSLLSFGAVLCRFSKQSNEAPEKHSPPAPNGTSSCHPNGNLSLAGKPTTAFAARIAPHAFLASAPKRIVARLPKGSAQQFASQNL
jgi:hypothetical protein